MKVLEPQERLIVAADFKPVGSEGVMGVANKVMSLARSLEGTGVCLKVNSALRAYGFDMINKIHQLGLSVFADLKLFDIKETLSTDGALLREFGPDILTVVCASGSEAMKALKAELPETEVLGVTTLTSIEDDESQQMFGCTTQESVLNFARRARWAEVDGLISAAVEAEMLREEFGLYLSLNTPAIRPHWFAVENDDQNPDRVMTPAKAIQAGADRIVIGRPIVKADDPRDAVMRTIEEIAQASR